ncbi:Dynein heavy chain family protein [Tritrichomonas foetus]|uniref:Dynein-1, subspecies f n=1 Tax=Tritrichomonas foetus TaxID=1144522 RepID=A0A1J4KHG4_9EUKA|nr:Dynein heavy chain family protein [Tritrichomonas foetus]|eukprot:OHT09102.1 Dynein heavy chain family protein [Tritrichomonas foetus]
MTDRFDKAKNHLLSNEKVIEHERLVNKRCGKPLPEEIIKIPKIGEWNLSQTKETPEALIEKQTQKRASSINTTNKKFKPFPTTIPLTSEQKARLQQAPVNESGSNSPKTRKNAPYKIKAPRSVDDFSAGVQGKVNYPPGTTSTDLNSIIKSKFRAQNKPLPPLPDKIKAPSATEKNILPLEVFDDTSVAEYTVEELLQRPDAVSRYTDLNGKSKWSKCTVTDYDEETELFTIKWKANGKVKKVARFNIRFECESEHLFNQRLEMAKESCHRYELLFRLDNRIKQMETEELPNIDIESILHPENLKPANHHMPNDPTYEKLKDELLEDANNNFKYLNNKLEFFYELEHNPLIPNRDDFLTLLPTPPPIPKYGLVTRVDYNFQELLKTLEGKLLLANANMLTGIISIYKIFQQSLEFTFLTDGYENEMISLEEFTNREQKQLSEMTKHFKTSIQETLESALGATLVDEPDFHTNLNTKARFQRLMTLLMRMLHTILLTIVGNTLKKYASLYEKYLITETWMFVSPQFEAELIFTEEKVFDCSPSLDTFREQILSLLFSLEESLKSLPVVELPLLDLEPSDVSFDDCEYSVQNSRTELNETLTKLFQSVITFMNSYRHLEPVLGLDTDTYAKEFDEKGKRTLDEYRQQLNDFNKVFDIVNQMNENYKLGILFLKCSNFKELGLFRAKSLIINLLARMKEFAISELTASKNDFEKIMADIQKVPQTPEELADLKAYITHINETTQDRADRLRTACERFSFLDEYKYDITNDECKFQYQILQMPNNLIKQLQNTEQMVQVERVRMIRELRNNQKDLETEVLQMDQQIPTFISKYQDFEMAVEAAEMVNEMQQKLHELREKQEKYCSHERLFEFEPQQSKTLSKLVEDFMPLHVLWNLANDWFGMNTTWLDTPFPQIKPDAMNAFMIQAGKKMSKMKKDLQSQPKMIEKVLTPLGEQIDKFKHHLPLISKLRHPGIKTKHWEKISEIVGFKVMPSMELTLQGFLDLDLGRWNEKITEIASVAAQEYNIESSLDQMDAELQTLQFQTSEFRGTGHFILNQIDDIISIIDDQLMTTQTLLTSPYVAPVKKRATEKLAFLRHSHDTLDAWVDCQRGWLYLQPIFTGTSIQQKLHREARDWQKVDQMWSAMMSLTHNHPDFVNVMHRDRLLEDLIGANQLLETITQGLNEYLEAKRLGFPRFFFLSNDELISILSHTKDFDCIQKSMNKLFEYIQAIEVDNDNMITAMNDDGLEKVEFITPVDGNTAEIEDWLNAFEEEMKSTLKENISESLMAAPKKKREQWITEFPAQVILIANQIIWTQMVTTSIRSQKLKGIILLQQKYIEQLESLTAQIRQPLSPSTRQVISCLLINEVHNRDIINHLVEQEVQDIDTFKWQMQMRYYWEEGTVIVRSINNVYEYSYEYAGNSARLVITPLTDRCYQTLLSAFKQNLSGAPSGPAGTGKTETVRDCAKALGRSCVVYNCSEEVTPEQMSQFFAGLSSSGSWSCFDEFNRINIEVLSVIAQQVRSIQTAIAANAETFQLDARTLKLNVNAAICITMNPGYAGRTELPDNLKTLFRPCAMMVPDFGFIAEIMLFSGGFAAASILSRKLVALFDLCRKQLSKASHYDWGLRAMKAILTTAGKAKRSNLEEVESLLLVQTIADCTRPRLVSVDIPLFDGIIHDVFPDVSCKKVLSKNLESKLEEAYKHLKMQPLKHYLLKCNEIFETTIVRHGIMFVGGAMGGKSVAWKALQIALTNLAAEGEGMGVHVDSLNPKAISIPELYGLFDPVTSGWSDGVLSSHIRDCSASEPTEYKWILVDGPVDSLWIETMNSLLDDNKVLCLSNNERISLGNHCKMMFEVDDLSQASPATVSRCGMIYFDPSTLPWTALKDSWKDLHIESLPKLTEYVCELMDKYVPSMIQFIECDGKPAIGNNSMFVVRNLMKLLDSFFDIMRKPIQKPASDGEDARTIDPLNQSLYFSLFSSAKNSKFGYFKEEESFEMFERIFTFCLVWTFGAILLDESRNIFDNFLKDQLDKNSAKCQFPTKLTVFDYFVDVSKNDWCEWCDGKTGINLTEKKSIEQILIPTSESASAMFISQLMIHHSQHTLIHGPESCKTLVVKTLMDNVLDKSFDCKNLPLANCSVASNVLNVLRSFMHKSKGVFGPLTNQQLIIFLDNIGSVKPEIYGAQPPLELIRQFFDYSGWYNTANVEFQTIVGTTFLAGMGPEGAGLFGIPERLIRHFFYFHIPKYQKNSMSKILTQLLEISFSRYNEPIRDRIPNMVAASLDLFDECTTNLLPIPSKLHYIFSLRNIVRVLKGILLVDAKNLQEGDQFIRLWANEMSREFYDRFNSIEDRKWFSEKLTISTAKHFKIKIDRESIRFNDFADRNGSYREVKSSPDELLKVCRDLLEDHNREAQKPLDIVLFNEAVDHLSSLSRILSMKRGHALLVGVKSSGRKSLARLSLHMSQMEMFEIQITRTYNLNEWREDMKNLMRQCGQNDLPTGFVISDVQIVGNFQLEDISNLLINGEIPNLFERDEMEQIKADIAQNELITDGDPWSLFNQRVKKHLHIILVFSPFGSAFKESMLTFPALRTETTIDWYMPWSRDALDSVAKASLSKCSLGAEKTLKSVVNVCVQIHKSVEDAAKQFLQETKRFTACTPSRYFELLNTFVKRLKIQQKKNEELVTKYSGGVDKIVTTRSQVEELSHKLDRDIPMLQKKRQEVEIMLKELTVKQTEVEKTQAEVKAQSEVAEKEAAEAAETNRVAQEKLSAAQPILQAAQEAVDSMDKNALVNIKSLKVIHPALRSTFEAICIIFGRQPKKVDTGVPGVKEDDYWPETLSLLNDIQFVKKVKNYEVEKIPKQTIEKLKKYVGANKQERDQKLAAVQGGYQAVAQLYLWVCAAFDYWHVYQEILPKKIAAEQAAAKQAASEKVLAESLAHLKSVEDQLKSLQDKFNEEKAREQELQENVGRTQLRLSRAQKIMSGLSGETKRWSKSAEDLKNATKYLLGDTLLQVGCLTHLGAFSKPFRSSLIEKWKGFLINEAIVYTTTFNITQSLGNDPTIREWIVKGLPNDTHSIDNALIIANSDSAFPLLIDPQLSGTKWLRSEIGEKLVVLRFDQSDFLQRMRSCVSFGIPVLIENVGLKLDPLIDPILSRETMIIDGQKKIALGGEYIQYDDKFRLYLSTKYPNPIYSPEVCSQVTLINFTTTQEGLSDLLMNNLIEVERDDLDKKRIAIMQANAENTKKLKETEDEILHIVSNAGSDILDDDNAIETLQRAQKTSASIEQQMAASEKTEKQIASFRDKFSSVSDRAALLYFCASDFSVVDPMYQFSLKWFVNIFKNAIQQSEHPSDQTSLIAAFHSAIARQFYQSVSFSLFARHKLLFSTLMTIRILLEEKKVTPTELAFILSPHPSKEANKFSWLPEDIWIHLAALPEISDVFKDIINIIQEKEDLWKQYLESNVPETEKIPGLKLTPFQRLLILRVFHLHRVREGLRIFVTDSLGKEFVEPPALNLGKVFKDSSPLAPLIFIITPGIDPQDEIISVATAMEMDKYLKSYSLGRGRGKGAEELIENAAGTGMWVLLQNCHLSLSWMPRLEHILDNFDPESINPRFRLCLVTMSSPDFPIGILYQGTKLIYEIPKGIRENMLRIYSGFNTDEYNNETDDTEKKLTFHLSFFHAVVLERIQFGSIGWNIPYEFNPSDFAISKKHLKTFLNESTMGIIPFESLTYVIGELNYGGRVTDRWDRRLLLSLLQRFFSENIMGKNFTFGEKYPAPEPTAPLAKVEEILNTWPIVTEGADVGLSKNASTITARNDAMSIFNLLVEIQPTLVAASGSISEEQFALNLVESLIAEVPKEFNVHDFIKKYDLTDTINTVIHHEILLYNKLLDVIKKSLLTLQKGLKGLIVIDQRLELLNRRLLANRIPEMWLEHSFPSILTLRSYMNDLNMRIAFMDQWVRNERPVVFKLGAFYHPEEFLTAVLQVYARKYTVAFDSLRWITTVMVESHFDKPPDEGIYIEGPFLEGAKWDKNEKNLTECEQTELISSLPIMHLMPTQKTDTYDMNQTYECPLYRTQNRGSGALGLPNYIMSLFIPAEREPPDHWIQRSVATFITVQL